MKPLALTSSLLLAAGLLAAIITYASWPAFDPIAAAHNVATIAGIDPTTVDVSTFTDPEAPFRTALIQIALATAFAGLIGILLTLHARALTPTSSGATSNTPTPGHTPLTTP